MNRFLKRGICLALGTVMILSGCQSPTGEKGSSTQIKKEKEDIGSATQTKTVADLRKKYGEPEVDYKSSLMTVNRTDSIKLKVSYEPQDTYSDSLKNDYTIYQDENLSYPVEGFEMEYDSEMKEIRILPPPTGIGEIGFNVGADECAIGLSGDYLFDDHTNNGWGNQEYLYLAQYVDETTGEQLDKPIIQIVRVNAELSDTPKVTFGIDEEGYASLSWEPVEGATKYLLFNIYKEEDGLNQYTDVFAATNQTTWSTKDIDQDINPVVINTCFRNFSVSQDDMIGGIEKNNDIYDEHGERYIGVIAVDGNRASSMSNLVALKEYSNRLPNQYATYSNGDEVNYVIKSSIENLPAQVYITMCDGSFSPRLIEYDFDHVVIRREASVVKVDITGMICGTPFKKDYFIYTNDESNIEEQLSWLKERQEKLKNKGGDKVTDINLIEDQPSDEPTTPSKPEETTEIEEVPEKEETTEQPTKEPNSEEKTKITATSAMSEYIAAAMLQSMEQIDLSEFTESNNQNILIDASYEAIYQNPLIFGVDEIGFNCDTKILYVTYEEEKEEIVKKRREVKQKATEIVSQIIEDSMSDIEKEFAINEYLCTTAVYDYEALESAKKNNFNTVDDAFDDSFTPYGVLIKGKGVCASYAAAFKVLADEAGLTSVVVTGTLEGKVAHAWNRVLLNDEWKNLDVTNNDNDEVKNALLNISDSGANGILIEDDRYIMNDKIEEYTCESDQEEFYHYYSKYFGKDKIVEALIASLEAKDEVLLRTDYSMNQEEFNKIALKIIEKTGGKLNGYQWLGVIHLKR